MHLEYVTIIHIEPKLKASVSHDGHSNSVICFVLQEKIKDYLRFLTDVGETRFPIFAWAKLGKLGHFEVRMRLKIVKVITDPTGLSCVLAI